MANKELKEKKFEVKLKHFQETGILPKAVKHGNRLAAIKYECPCALCVARLVQERQKNLERSKKVLERYREYFELHRKLPEGVSHGSGGYGAGCRCDICITMRRQKQVNSDNKRRDKFKQGLSLEEMGVKHGLKGYQAGCRCDICKTTHKQATDKTLEAQRKHLKEHGTFLNPKTRHGTHAALKYWCDCAICSAFSTNYHKSLRERKMKQCAVVN